MSDEQNVYREDWEVEEVLRAFESCEIRPDDFGHREHLAVALCLVLRHAEGGALARMRLGLEKFIEANGITPTLYHETITLFWLKRARAYVAGAGAGASLAGLANGLARECADSRLIFVYYSRGLINSDAARGAWAEPDLRPLDF